VMPLRTSGSIAFPDTVEYDTERQRYRLGFMTTWGVSSAASYLVIDRRDLETAFDRSKKPEPKPDGDGKPAP